MLNLNQSTRAINRALSAKERNKLCFRVQALQARLVREQTYSLGSFTRLVGILSLHNASMQYLNAYR